MKHMTWKSVLFYAWAIFGLGLYIAAQTQQHAFWLEVVYMTPLFSWLWVLALTLFGKEQKKTSPKTMADLSYEDVALAHRVSGAELARRNRAARTATGEGGDGW